MHLRLKYKTIDVFTTSRFRGNPLAIVHVPAKTDLTNEQKLSIAREFNLSETVFLHEPHLAEDQSTDGLSVQLDIYITEGEIPFAGHPTVGTGWYLLSGISGLSSSISLSKITLRVKAGEILVTRGTGSKVLVPVPIDFKVHPKYIHPKVKSIQRLLKAEDYINGLGGAEPIVSIVKGMTFLLLQLTSKDALSRMHGYSDKLVLPDGYLGEWEGYTSVYAFFIENEDELAMKLHTRMFGASLEDPATGSAASALTGYLAEKSAANTRGKSRKKFAIIQGLDMGRRSDIGVTVTVVDGKTQKIDLEGEAVEVSEGTILV